MSSSVRGSGSQKTRILIVDEDSFAIDHLTGTLSLKGHEVLTAMSKQEAQDAFTGTGKMKKEKK